MFAGETMTERHGRLLAAFAVRAARLAEDLADRAIGTDDAMEAADLARAFHMVGRSLRQAIALEQRLERDAARAQREDADSTANTERNAIAERKQLVEAQLRPLSWREAETLDADEDDGLGEDYSDLCERIERVVAIAAAVDPAGFLAEPLPLQLRRLAAEAGLPSDAGLSKGPAIRPDG